MNPDILLVVLISLTIVSYALSLVFVIGIVWRVELQLDRSYKFFAWAVFLLLLAEVVEIYPGRETEMAIALLLKGLRSLAALLLFLGMYSMRDLVRKIDGEKTL